MTDSELLTLLDEDAERGLAAMIAQYGGYVYTAVRSKLRDAAEEDIEETVSDVFIAFWQWRCTHTGEPVSIRALLAVIAKRRAVSRFYALTKHPAAEPLDALTAPSADSAQPDDSVILMQSVMELGEPDSEIVLRKYYFGQSSREIAAVLHMTAAAVEQRLSRARKRLRAVWKGE